LRYQSAQEFKKAANFWLQSCQTGQIPRNLPRDKAPASVPDERENLKKSIQNLMMLRHKEQLQQTVLMAREPARGPTRSQPISKATRRVALLILVCVPVLTVIAAVAILANFDHVTSAWLEASRRVSAILSPGSEKKTPTIEPEAKEHPEPGSVAAPESTQEDPGAAGSSGSSNSRRL
jgi:hypothetical protein